MITVSDAVPFAIKCSLQISLVRENVREKKKKRQEQKAGNKCKYKSHVYMPACHWTGCGLGQSRASLGAGNGASSGTTREDTKAGENKMIFRRASRHAPVNHLLPQAASQTQYTRASATLFVTHNFCPSVLVPCQPRDSTDTAGFLSTKRH